MGNTCNNRNRRNRIKIKIINPVPHRRMSKEGKLSSKLKEDANIQCNIEDDEYSEGQLNIWQSIWKTLSVSKAKCDSIDDEQNNYSLTTTIQSSMQAYKIRPSKYLFFIQ